MSSWDRRGSGFALLFLAALALADAPGGKVVVLVDTSRSIPSASFRAAGEFLGKVVSRLPEGTPIEVWSVDDLAEARGGPGALAGLERRGSRTVLHDGLLGALRAAGRGGVVILASDGLDDGSATTADDVGRIAREIGVPIVAVGVGPAEARGLRRLALLSGGSYLGPVERSNPDELALAVQAYRASAPSTAEEEKPAEPAPKPAPEVLPAAPEVEIEPGPREGVPGRDWPSDWVLVTLGLAGFGAAGLGGYLLARAARRRSALDRPVEEDYGTSPGVALEGSAEGREKGLGFLEELDPVRIAEVRNQPPVRPGGLVEASPREAEGRVNLPRDQVFERTLVLQEEMGLTVLEPGREARIFRLPERRAVWIGRDASRNTLAFSDPTLSGQHLRLFLDSDGSVLLIDSDSTNGTFVRDRRVKSCRLRAGDRFRAGLVEFELKLLHRSPV